MKKNPKVNDYVVLNKNPEATIFVVTGVDGRNVTIIDSNIPANIKQRGYTCDISLVQLATKKQLAA